MIKAYSLKDTTERLEKALVDINSFYNASCLTWGGKTSEGFYYSEAIAENLLRLGIKNRLSQISPIQRKNYKVDHDGVTQRRTSRYEEICAKALYKRDLPYIGRIIDYQVPLKALQADKAGKIDLISYRDNPKNDALIIELKFKGNKETLLRAALEISTYYHMLSHENFLASYDEFTGFKPLDIKKALLLGEGTRSYDDARDLDRFPNAKRLLQELEMELYGLVEGHPEIERITL